MILSEFVGNVNTPGSTLRGVSMACKLESVFLKTVRFFFKKQYFFFFHNFKTIIYIFLQIGCKFLSQCLGPFINEMANSEELLEIDPRKLKKIGNEDEKAKQIEINRIKLEEKCKYD